MLASDLVARQPSVILADGILGTIPVVANVVAKYATSTIPLVFYYAGDPVEDGLVAGLNRPGGNVTGITSISGELAGKRLNLLRDLVPQAKTVVFLTGTASYVRYRHQTRLMLEAGRALGLQIVVVERRDDDWDFERAFATIAERGADALILGTFPFGTSLSRATPSAVSEQSQQDRSSGSASQDTNDVCGTTVYGQRRAGKLRPRSADGVPSTCHPVHRPHPQRSEACRPTGAAADEVRVDHKSTDRQEPGDYRASATPCSADEVIE